VEKLCALADGLLGAVLIFAVVFGPWAFGTTEQWSIRVMNYAGIGAWIVVILKWLLLRRDFLWTLSIGSDGSGHVSRERLFHKLFALVTVLFLLYCLASALNARATFHPNAIHFTYHPIIDWLPHSYDSGASWQAFWQYMGIAGFFWAAHSWIKTGAKAERRKLRESVQPRVHGSSLLPGRMRLLLWVLSINGAILAVEGIVQRMAGCNRLLWLAQPTINKDALSQFGPYAYRSNAAQYFNLLWPVTLGFWWTLQQATRRGLSVFRSNNKTHHLLISCALLMALCPIISTTRGGAIVMVANAVLAGAVFLISKWRTQWKTKLAVFGLLGLMVGGGLVLGWQELAPRMESSELQAGIEGREGLFTVGWRMADASPVFGTGPGTFSSLYPLFRESSTDKIPGQLHNDWLEILITFGWVGTAILLAGLALVLARWFFNGRIYGERHFVMLIWIALGGCLVHAVYDFPLQIHSVLMVFVLNCAVLSCLSRKGG
jgi:O-antigen ligase